MAGSKGYNSRANVSNAPGAFYVIYATDFGAPVPAAPALAVAGVSGSLVTGTLFVEVTWITAEGESLPSPQASQAVVTNDRVTVTQPTVPAQGQTVIGWRVYSAATSGSEALNSAGTVETTQNFVTNSGTIAGFPVATTAIHVNVAGTGAAPPAVDQSGIQAALPLVPPSSGVEYYAVVPNSGSQWKQQKSVDFMRSDGVVDPAGIVLNHLDFIQPDYPGAVSSGSSYSGSASVATGTFAVVNGYLYQATIGGTTGATFPKSIPTTKGSTFTDGTVTWTCFGKAGLVRFAFSNVTTTPAGGLAPASQTYELFQQ